MAQICSSQVTLYAPCGTHSTTVCGQVFIPHLILNHFGLDGKHDPLRRNLLQILVDWRTLFEQQVPTAEDLRA